MPAFVQVFMSRDASKYMGLDVWTTVDDLRDMFAKSIGLEDGIEDFKIAEHRLGKLTFLDGKVKVLDIIKGWPKVHNSSLWFARYYWVASDDSNAELQRLSYYRIQGQVLTGDVFVTPDTAYTLAAMELQRRLNLTSNNIPRDYLESSLTALLPRIYISEKDTTMACARIRSAIAPYIGISPGVVVSMLSRVVKDYGWYRKTFVKGTFVRKGNERIDRPVYIACDIGGLHILFFPSMDEGGFYPYELIQSWGVEMNVCFIGVRLPEEGEDIRCYFNVDEEQQQTFIKVLKGYVKRVSKVGQKG